jgi:hypothetical protein
MAIIRGRAIPTPTFVQAVSTTQVIGAATAALSLSLPSSGTLQAADRLVLFLCGIGAYFSSGASQWGLQSSAGRNGEDSELRVYDFQVSSAGQNISSLNDIQMTGVIAASRVRAVIAHYRPAPGRSLNPVACSTSIYVSSPLTNALLVSAVGRTANNISIAYVIEEGSSASPTGAPWTSDYSAVAGAQQNEVFIDSQIFPVSGNTDCPPPVNSGASLRTATAVINYAY